MLVAIWRGLSLGACVVVFIQTSAVAQAPTPYHSLISEPTHHLQWKTAVAQARPTGSTQPSTKRTLLPSPSPLEPSEGQSATGFNTNPDSAKLAQLREDIAALIGSTKDTTSLDETPSTDRARLQGQLDELLKRLNSQPPRGSDPRSPSVPQPPKTKFDPTDTRPIDNLRLAMNLFRDEDFDAAYRAFSYIQPSQLPPEDRPFVRYMTASCLRRLNRLSEAAVIYREVAEMTEDEFIASSAISQLTLMRTVEELEAQLGQIRARMKDR
jgi:hypothetical protein